MIKLRHALVAISFVGNTTALAAQGFSVGPTIGYYRPFRQFDSRTLFTTDLPDQPGDLAGVAWGLDATVRLHGRFGAEGIFATVASTVPACTCPGGPLPPTGERVTLMAIAGQYRLPLAGSAYYVALSAGPATIQHGGEGYGRYGSPRSWGGVGAVEITRRIASHLEAGVRAMALGYSFHLSFPPQSGTQLDGLLSVTARWRFGDGAF